MELLWLDNPEVVAVYKAGVKIRHDGKWYFTGIKNSETILVEEKDLIDYQINYFNEKEYMDKLIKKDAKKMSGMMKDLEKKDKVRDKKCDASMKMKKKK